MLQHVVGTGHGDVDARRFGPYLLLGLLGRGGMGEVWRAYDTRRDRIVALQLLLEQLTDETFAARFRDESRIVARMRSPHVVPIHDFGGIQGRLFLDMRLIEGSDLAALLRRGPLPPGRAVHIVGQVADALAAAHRDGLVHRDVKPSNILLADTEPGRADFAYLVDFGIAVATDSTTRTATGQPIGTAAYMSPERIDGSRGDQRADVYALGCVLFECLTGQRPYPSTDLVAQFFAHLNRPVPRPSDFGPGIPPAFDTVIAAAMAKDPRARTPTATDLAGQALTALTAPETVLPLARPRPAVRWRLAAAAAAAAVVVAAAAVLVPALDGRDDPATDPPATGPASPQFAAGTTMARLAESGTVRIGTRQGLPLYSLPGVGGDREGFEIGLSDREAALEQGRVDLVVATYTITETRQQRVTFAGPYVNAGQTLMVRRDNTTITGPDSLRGDGSVCGVAGSTPVANIAQFVDPGQIVELASYPECATALRSGEVNAVTSENVVLIGLAATSGGAYTVLDAAFTTDPYGVGVPRGDLPLCEFVNATLAAASADGRYEQAWTLTAGVVSADPACSHPLPVARLPLRDGDPMGCSRCWTGVSDSP